MFSFFRKIRSLLKRYAQALFVAAAFALMAVSSYLYVGTIERKNVQKSIKDVIFYTEAKIKADLLESETPKDRYYRGTKNLAIMLAILGILLSGVLIMILLRISAEKDKANERVRVMFDVMPLGAVYHDKDFKVLDCNKGMLNLFGLSSKQEYIDKFYDLLPERQPDGSLSSEKMAEYVKKAFTEGYLRVEWTHRNTDGEPVPCEVTLVRVKHDNEFALLAFVRDLRELKSVVTQMNQSKQSLNILENILNGLDAMIYVTVPQTGEILFINNYMKKHYNIEGDGVGQLCYKVFLNGLDDRCDFCPCHQLDREPHSTVVWEKLNTLTNRICRNTDRYMEWHDGRTVHIQHSVDVTELITAKEQAVQANKEKNGFLAQMSHEIRTPMNAILGITEIQLQNETLPPEMREALDRIYNAGYLLLGVINNILDLYKVEAGKLELAPVKYNVASLINDIIHLSVTRFENRAVEFVLEVDENIPSSLFGDDLRIKQILNNLLSNSFKYTDSGKVSLLVTFEKESEENASQITLILRVSDTGQGMTAEQVDRLFDEYFSTEINRSIERAGLGMSITKRLVGLMGGKITVESEPDKGSAFTVRLPQEIADGGILGTALAENLRQFRLGKTPQILREYMPYGKVLVVDDVEINLYVARGMMAPYGLSVETAASGFEAVNKIKSGASYDIIFMDHFMPKMDGLEAAKIIRKLGYTHSIIALTANVPGGQEDIFLANGFDWFISKPIDTRQLNEALNKFIRDKYPPEVVRAAQRYAAVLEKPKDRPLSEQELVAIFAQDAEKAIAVLEPIHANNYRRNDDIQLYIITLHAMKTALASIGETELFTMALNLERAGREGNTAEMAADTPAFFDALRALIERNKPKNKNEDEETTDDISDDEREFLRKKLHAIELACTAYDKRTANEALIDLRKKKWPHSAKELLDTIARHLLHSEFEEIVSLIDSSKGNPI